MSIEESLSEDFCKLHISTKVNLLPLLAHKKITLKSSDMSIEFQHLCIDKYIIHGSKYNIKEILNYLPDKMMVAEFIISKMGSITHSEEENVRNSLLYLLSSNKGTLPSEKYITRFFEAIQYRMHSDNPILKKSGMILSAYFTNTPSICDIHYLYEITEWVETDRDFISKINEKYEAINIISIPGVKLKMVHKDFPFNRFNDSMPLQQVVKKINSINGEQLTPSTISDLKSLYNILNSTLESNTYSPRVINTYRGKLLDISLMNCEYFNMEQHITLGRLLSIDYKHTICKLCDRFTSSQEYLYSRLVMFFGVKYFIDTNELCIEDYKELKRFLELSKKESGLQSLNLN